MSKEADVTTVGDRVKLKKDNLVGVVRFIGEMQGKKDIFYGIELDDKKGKNNGSLKKVPYFKCGKKKGLFVKKTAIAKSNKKNNKDAPRVTVGDKVKVTKTKCKGTIRFIGTPYSVKEEGVFYGVELEKPKGKNNGTVKDRWYFTCKAKYGTFVQSGGFSVLSLGSSAESSPSDNFRKQYIPSRPLEIIKSIEVLNITTNTPLINREILLFGTRVWNQKTNRYCLSRAEGSSVTITGCDERMSQLKGINTTDNEFKSMLSKSDNNYMRIMSDIFDPYLNGIKSVLHIILLYKGRHLIPIRCHIDLLPYFHRDTRNYRPRQNLWNKAKKDRETGMVTTEWIPDQNLFVIEDIYDEWKAHIMNELKLRNNVSEEAIFYVPDGDIFMAIHSNNNRKKNVLRQKNVFTRLYIESLTNFHECAEYAFCVDLAGINYSYYRTFEYENSCGSRSRCWDGDGLVLLADGNRKLIKDLCINDNVAVLEKLPNDVVIGYKTATVMVKIESVVNRKYDMVYVDKKLWITPYHAVLVMHDDEKHKNTLKWKMPCDLNKIEQRFVTSIYNFILDVGHVLNVNGVWANTLGHDLSGPVIQNPFWGNSNAMNQYLSQKEGYPNIVEYI